MATIRERIKNQNGKAVPVFHVQVRMAGYPARTATFPTKRLAERWAKTIEAEMIEGKHFRSVEARRRTVADAIDRYIREELHKKTDATSHGGRLKWWHERLGKLKLSEITPALIVECRGELASGTYVRAKPHLKHSIKHGEMAPEYRRSAGTVRHYLNALSVVFTLARKEWRWTSVNPFEEVSRPSAGRKSIRFLSEEERARLLKETAKDPELHTFVVLALSIACRAGDLAKLRWKDVDLDAGRLLLRTSQKSEPRVAWVGGEALRLLKAHDPSRREEDELVFVSETGKRYRHHTPFVAACKAAKVEKFTFHGLRHSSATYLAREGATEQQLKAIGGWKSNVVSRYVHMVSEDAKAVVEKMNERILGGGNK
jgi:integrase